MGITILIRQRGGVFFYGNKSKLSSQSKKESNWNAVNWCPSKRGNGRIEQPVGKQYTFDKGPEYENETAKLLAENRYLKQQIEVLNKYAELERKWFQK